jgi:hypothetical protein
MAKTFEKKASPNAAWGKGSRYRPRHPNGEVRRRGRFLILPAVYNRGTLRFSLATVRDHEMLRNASM